MDAHASIHDDPRPALVCVDDEARRTTVLTSLEQLGYQPVLSEDSETAIELMRKTGYHVVVVDEAYEGTTSGDNAVLKALSAMPMPTRRYIFVALLGEDVKTLDNATAFARSVNAVINESDVGGLGSILRRAVADNDAFYRPLREVLQAAGKR
jgi:CheY-like chemotaxis protein